MTSHIDTRDDGMSAVGASENSGSQDAHVLREGTTAGAFLLFVVAEMAFYVAIGLLNQGTVDGILGWSQLAAGNIIGCGLLGLTLLRTHPQLPNEFRLAMKGTGTWSLQ
jgi:hypothetical protein